MPVVAAMLAVGLLPRRDRGVPHRAQVPHAGLSPLRRVPRERLRAVAPARRSTRCPTSRPTFATEPNFEGRVPAVPARRADARAAVGGAGHAGPRASHRRPREGRPHGEHLVRPRQPRPDDAPARAEGRGHRGRHPGARGRRPRRRRDGARARLGRDVRPDRRRRAGACARTAARSRTRTCATSTRSRATRARCCAATSKVLVPEMNLGQLLKLVRARVPRRRGRLQPRDAACRCARPRSRRRSKRWWIMSDGNGNEQADREGLPHRPGGALVPGLRRLRDPRRDAVVHAGARHRAREHRVRERASAARRASRTT